METDRSHIKEGDRSRASAFQENLHASNNSESLLPPPLFSVSQAKLVESKSNEEDREINLELDNLTSEVTESSTSEPAQNIESIDTVRNVSIQKMEDEDAELEGQEIQMKSYSDAPSELPNDSGNSGAGADSPSDPSESPADNNGKNTPIQKQEGTADGSRTSNSGLSPDLMGKMENTIGHDFSNVNIHTNSSRASEVGALAYTQGSDLHFAPGQFNPGTSSGQELIGHELAHVKQQAQGRVRPTTTASNGMAVNDDKGLETEADQLGAKAASGSVPVQRKEDANNSNATSSNNSIIQKYEDDERIPFNEDGTWNGQEIINNLGQHSTGSFDSMSSSCAEAAAMAAYILEGPGATATYLQLLIGRMESAASPSILQSEQPETLRGIIAAIRAQGATSNPLFYFDLNQAIESIYDYFVQQSENNSPTSGTSGGQIQDIAGDNLEGNSLEFSEENTSNRVADSAYIELEDVIARANGLTVGQRMMVFIKTIQFSSSVRNRPSDLTTIRRSTVRNANAGGHYVLIFRAESGEIALYDSEREIANNDFWSLMDQIVASVSEIANPDADPDIPADTPSARHIRNSQHVYTPQSAVEERLGSWRDGRYSGTDNAYGYFLINGVFNHQETESTDSPAQGKFESARENLPTESQQDNVGTAQQKSKTSSNFSNDNQRVESSPNIIQKMEASFGTSFSGVKIHENSSKATDAGALAYAQGNSIHFAPGQFKPNTRSGQELIGHELAHVVQQREGRVKATIQGKDFQINDDPSLESEADEMGRKAARGQQLPFNLGNNSNITNSPTQQKIVQRTLSDEELEEVIRGLRTLGDQENAVRLLRENHSDLERINAAFLESTNGVKTLRQYINTNYFNLDMKVKATALLFDSSYDHDWTRIALALIPDATRDNDYYQIMNSLSNQQKSELRRRYDARFLMIGNGSLDADIHSDFDGVDYLRAWIISYRRLTDADNIYLHTQHLTSSNADQVRSTLTRLWAYGLNTFNTKLQEWNPNNSFTGLIPTGADYRYYFHHAPSDFTSKWPLIPGKAKSLILTVLHQSHSDATEQIFIEYVNQSTDRVNGVTNETIGWAFTTEEEANLNIARARLTSAEHWYDDNEDEIDAASEQIVAIYQARIDRLEVAEASADQQRRAASALTQVRVRLARNHETSVSSLVELTLADELYQLRNSQTNYTNKILEIYKQNRLDELREHAQTAASVTIGGETLSRPAYDIKGPLRVNDTRGGRMHNFLDRENDDAGSYWIKDSIDRELVQPPTLTSLNTFINTGPWNETLLVAVLRYFNSRNVSRTFLNDYPNSPKRAFLRHMASIGFDEFSNWRTFRDSLVPSTTDQETEARAHEDWEQEHNGSIANAVSDVFTGEDTEDVASSSLRRLETFANDANASSEEMRVFRAFYGEQEDLVTMEYGNFQQRLGEMREAKNEAAAMANTIVSTAIEAILSPFISPAGGAVVGQVCGILTEWMLNPEYDPATPENLGNIITSAATAGASRWTGNSGGFTSWINNRTSNRFLRAAAREAMEQTIQTSADAFSAGMRGNLNMDWVRGQIQSVLAARLASGVVSTLDIEITENAVINEAFSDMTETVVAEILTVSSSMVFNEGEDENAVMARLAESVITGLISSIAEHIGETHAEARQENQESQAADRMRADADVIEENNIPSGPDLTRNSEERTAIVPHTPTEERTPSSEGEGGTRLIHPHEIDQIENLHHPDAIVRTNTYLETHRDALEIGSRSHIEGILNTHGTWRDLMIHLSRDRRNRVIVLQLLAHRDRISVRVQSLFEARVPPASERPESDIDISMMGDHAGENLLAAENHMRERYGQEWEDKLRMNFYTDPARHQIMSLVEGRMDEATLQEHNAALSSLTEELSIVQMLEFSSGDHESEDFSQEMFDRLTPEQQANVRGHLNQSPEQREQERRELHLQVDELATQFRLARDGEDTESQEALALRISLMQTRLNFLTEEAYVGAGATRAVVSREMTGGHGTYQYAISQLPMMMHIVHVSGDNLEAGRRYEFWKYVRRYCEACDHAGIENARINYFRGLATHIDRQYREGMNADAHTPEAMDRATEEGHEDQISGLPVTNDHVQEQIQDFFETVRETLPTLRERADGDVVQRKHESETQTSTSRSDENVLEDGSMVSSPEINIITNSDEGEAVQRQVDNDQTLDHSSSSSKAEIPANVNLHQNSSEATNMGALAFAQGSDIHFAPGQFKPDTQAGQELIGHELAHVQQQKEGRVQPTSSANGKPINDDKGLEKEADDHGKKFAENNATQLKSDASIKSSNRSSSSREVIQNKVDPIQMLGGYDSMTPPTITPADHARVNARMAARNSENMAEAIRTGDIGSIRAITDFSSATPTQRMVFVDKILEQWWISPWDEVALERIWNSFGENIAEVGSREENKARWDECLEMGMDPSNIRALTGLRDNFKLDVQETAKDYIRANILYAQDEMVRLGLRNSNEEESPTAEIEQQLRWEETQYLASETQRLLEGQRLLRQVHVGYRRYMTVDRGGSVSSSGVSNALFNPSRRPDYTSHPDTDEDPAKTWEDTKAEWDKSVAAINAITSQSPAVYAAFSSGGDNLDNLSEDNPETARETAATLLNDLERNGQLTLPKIDSLDLDWKDLVPIHNQLYSGTKRGPSEVDWGNGFNKSVARDVIGDHETREFWIALGLGTASAAAFIVSELATGGAATGFWLGVGIGISGAQAVSSWENWEDLDTANNSAASHESQLVEEGQVNAALLQAIVDSVFAFVDVVTPAVKGALALRSAARLESALMTRSAAHILENMGELTARESAEAIQRGIAELGVEETMRKTGNSAEELSDIIRSGSLSDEVAESLFQRLRLAEELGLGEAGESTIRTIGSPMETSWATERSIQQALADMGTAIAEGTISRDFASQLTSEAIERLGPAQVLKRCGWDNLVKTLPEGGPAGAKLMEFRESIFADLQRFVREELEGEVVPTGTRGNFSNDLDMSFTGANASSARQQAMEYLARRLGIENGPKALDRMLLMGMFTDPRRIHAYDTLPTAMREEVARIQATNQEQLIWNRRVWEAVEHNNDEMAQSLRETMDDLGIPEFNYRPLSGGEIRRLSQRIDSLWGQLDTAIENGDQIAQRRLAEEIGNSQALINAAEEGGYFSGGGVRRFVTERPGEPQFQRLPGGAEHGIPSAERLTALIDQLPKLDHSLLKLSGSTEDVIAGVRGIGKYGARVAEVAREAGPENAAVWRVIEESCLELKLAADNGGIARRMTSGEAEEVIREATRAFQTTIGLSDSIIAQLRNGVTLEGFGTLASEIQRTTRNHVFLLRSIDWTLQNLNICARAIRTGVALSEIATGSATDALPIDSTDYNYDAGDDSVAQQKSLFQRNTSITVQRKLASTKLNDSSNEVIQQKPRIPSSVNINENSAQASEMGALAYTQGSNIHFAPGQFKPDTQAGQELIGHELAHVQQQKEGRVQPTSSANGKPINDDKGLEKEADDFGVSFAKSLRNSSSPEAENNSARQFKLNNTGSIQRKASSNPQVKPFSVQTKQSQSIEKAGIEIADFGKEKSVQLRVTKQEESDEKAFKL